MTVRHARVIALAAVLVGTSALGPATPIQAQQRLDELPLNELRVLAEQGDVEAQADLGHRYSVGQGVAQDDAEAVRWYRLAADQGLASAQFTLGKTEPCFGRCSLGWRLAYRLPVPAELATAQGEARVVA